MIKRDYKETISEDLFYRIVEIFTKAAISISQLMIFKSILLIAMD